MGGELFFGPTITVKNCVDQGTKKGISCGIINLPEWATKSLDCNSDAPIPTTLCTVRVDLPKIYECIAPVIRKPPSYSVSLRD